MVAAPPTITVTPDLGMTSCHNQPGKCFVVVAALSVSVGPEFGSSGATDEWDPGPAPVAGSASELLASSNLSSFCCPCCGLRQSCTAE